jgi:acetyl-CoA carboxylase biotin carboxyl carrier protein
MDLNEIERLLELMREHDIVECEFFEKGEDGARLKLKKATPPEPQPAPSHPVLTPALAIPAQGAVPPAPAPAAPPAAAPAAAAEEEVDEERANLTEVPSPMVGTFYRAASPDSEPFCEVGTVITDETVVCIIEAMKVMNEIKAEVAGEVVEILVQNGEAVEFGQPLFLIRTE